jgi:hypothetical protein
MVRRTHVDRDYQSEFNIKASVISILQLVLSSLFWSTRVSVSALSLLGQKE